jgi:hypothetical protein
MLKIPFPKGEWDFFIVDFLNYNVRLNEVEVHSNQLLNLKFMT